MRFATRLTIEKLPIAPGGCPNTGSRSTRGAVMRESPMRPEQSSLTYESPWRDIAVVIGITALSILCADYFDLNEALYALTRRGERFQIDELPIGMLVLLICLIWLSRRRYGHAQHEVFA